MDYQIKSFLELNLIVDAALLLLFCFTVLLRNPKLLIFLIILNLCQYVVWVPDEEILEAHRKMQEQHLEARQLKKSAQATTPSSLPSQITESLTSPENAPTPLDAANLYDHISSSLGAATPSANMQVSLDAWKKTREASEKNYSEGISLNVTSVLLSMASDPHAAWFVARLFWLAATFYLYMQRPQIGVVVFSLNLLPIPFLSQFIPYLWYRFNQIDWVQDLNAQAKVNVFPKEFVESMVYYGFIFVILILPLLFIGFAYAGRNQKNKEKGLHKYLNPDEYDLLIEGLKIPFTIEGSILTAGDFQLDIRKLSFDPENPHVWYLKTGTKIVFQSKHEPEPSPQTSTSFSTAHSDKSWKSRRSS
jgi:hypothetical protein